MSQQTAPYNQDGYLEDIHYTEKEKASEEYLKNNIDFYINNLVREKKYIKTYRNYYNGVRDNEEFKYLTENFGIGTPSKLGFTPLIKPRVDALVAVMVEETFTYRATVVDDKTIDIAEEIRKNKYISELTSVVENFVASNITAAAGGDQQGGMPVSELQVQSKKIESKYGQSYLSDFEVAAQDLLKFFENDHFLDLSQKLKQMAQDLILTGECYYRVYCERVGSDPVLDVIKPENIFYNKNTNSQYIDSCDAIVHREYLTRKEVLRKYGKYMDDVQQKVLFSDRARIKTARSLRSGRDLDRYYGADDPVNGQKSYSNLDVVEVYHVEWKALNEVRIDEIEIEDQNQTEGYKSDAGQWGWRTDRYEGVRIANSVYINCGKSTHIVRSETRPFDCGFTYGGVVYNDRGGKPYALAGALKDLQDVYDLTLFYRDNLIANSGVPGSRINIAGIPKQLGSNFMDRLMKFVAMKKNGFELIDPTEPGAQLFNHYGEFDNSVNGNSLQAIELMLKSMERQADVTAATNPQMLGQIAQRDAVSNVKQGIHQSLMINADLFDLLRTNHKRLLNDMLDISKVCYKKGKKGAYILGSESYLFNIMPDLICFSDHAINVSYSSKDAAKLADLKASAKEMIAAQLLDPDVMVHIILSDSATEVKQIIDKAWSTKKIETGKESQLTQTAEQLKQQVDQLTNELTKAKQQIEGVSEEDRKLKTREMDIKEFEVNKKLELEDKKQKDTKLYQNAQVDVKHQLAQLEREQLYLTIDNGSDGGNSSEPKNNI